MTIMLTTAGHEDPQLTQSAIFKVVKICWFNFNFIPMQGKIGVNTDSPEEALSVNGNLQVTGQILQPSYMRLKTVNVMQVRRNHDHIDFLCFFSVEYDSDAQQYFEIKSVSLLVQE